MCLAKKILKTPPANKHASLESALRGDAHSNSNGTHYVINLVDSEVEREIINLTQELVPNITRIEKLTKLSFDINDLLFIDIETTALSSTSPLFLIGTLALASGEAKQFLARTPSEEPALLKAFAELPNQKVLVSFNGLAFDWPYLLHRSQQLQVPLSKPRAHFDLLPFARKKWIKQVPDCRLQTLEKYFCRKFRADDIPGSHIPETYQQFCQTYPKTGQGAHLLQPIAYHNLWDLITTAQLFSSIGN